MQNVGIFYGLLIYFTAIWYILRPLGIFYGYLVYLFSRFGMLYLEKSGNPGWRQCQRLTGKTLPVHDNCIDCVICVFAELRVTRWVREKKIVQNVSKFIFGQNSHTTFFRGRKKANNLVYIIVQLKKTTQRKQLPNGRKSAPTGHPEWDPQFKSKQGDQIRITFSIWDVN
jgi:hypothetical protein